MGQIKNIKLHIVTDIKMKEARILFVIFIVSQYFHVQSNVIVRPNNAARKCSQRGHHAPCACTVQLTEFKFLQKSGEMVTVEIPEYVCMNEVNKERMDNGHIVNGFKCVQIYKRKIVYEDVNDDTIHPPKRVNYQFGCELRCTHSKCNRSK